MNAEIKRDYKLMRSRGFDAAYAYRAAKIWDIFESMRGSVRIRGEADEVDHDWCHIYTESERQHILETYGCWFVLTEYKTPSGEWEFADGIGECTGYDIPISPAHNQHVPDLMESAIEQHAQAWTKAGQAI
tara:strand:- start:189 stop:581 length:393 start_codon:yes stop_codon:yes gene_type:complete